MTILLHLLLALLRAILPALMNRPPDTVEDAAPQTALRNRLRERIRATWGRSAVIVVLLLAMSLSGGCWLQRNRTVYVHSGEPVRIRQTIRNAKVWVMGANGRPVAGVMDIEAGWYALDIGEESVPLAPIIPGTGSSGTTDKP